jgi:protease IV
MDEMTMPEPEPVPPAAEAHPPGARRVKRRLMASLIALYGLSLAAATVIILQGKNKAVKKEDGKGGLLAAMTEQSSVGWVSIHGAIYNSEGGRPWEKGAEQWGRKIKQMADSKGVKAIVLDINSPGGSVGAVQELHSVIMRVRKEKNIPVVALFGDVSASGGYYIAAACDRIVAHPGTLTGSIGVIFNVSNLEGLFSKVGYKSDPIKSGKHKDIGSPARPMTAEERNILQALIMDAYGQFVGAVAEGRRLPEDEVRRLADGRIYTGKQALDNKLVDKLGDSVDAVELAAQLGGIQGRPKVKRDVEKISDIFDLLESRFDGLIGRSSVLDRLVPAARFGLEYRWEP